MSTHDLSNTEPTSGRVQARPLGGSDAPRERLLAGLPVTERRLSLNGSSTAVLEGGAGPPIVLLHGPGAYAAHWLRVIPGLVRTHRVIAPDLPGHGASAALDGAGGIERVIGWLDDLIECTCETPPVVVGHTLGGAIAVSFAAARTERLSALVLVDTLGLVAFEPAPEFGAALTEFLAQPSADTHDLLWKHCAFDLGALQTRLGATWQSIRAYNLERARAPGAIRALHELLTHFGLPAIAPSTLARITVPTTLIWGRHDRATPLSVAEEASQRYRWRLHVIDGAADDPTLEQPERFLRALRRALNEQRSVR